MTHKKLLVGNLVLRRFSLILPYLDKKWTTLRAFECHE